MKVLNRENVSYDRFKEQWLQEVKNETTNVGKGKVFACKLISEWLDIDPDDEDFYYTDGSHDGGIDVAVLRRSNEDETESGQSDGSGDTWYLIQSKYGTSLHGKETILSEGSKIFDTLAGTNKLSVYADDVVEKVQYFFKRATDNDKLILVIASVDPLAADQIKQIDAMRKKGNEIFERYPFAFDVQSVNLGTTYEEANQHVNDIELDLKGEFVASASNTYVGTATLFNIYSFLRNYRTWTGGDIDRLYAYNIRRWLGRNNRVNTGIKNTVLNEPEKFGVYNNGITFVVRDFQPSDTQDVWRTKDPFIVNGCQTTRTLFDVLDKRLNSGGGRSDSEFDDWRAKLDEGCVVVKIVWYSQIEEIENITRFTNLQSAVRGADFVALNEQYQNWQDELFDRYGRYLEIQRGGWDSFKALHRATLDTGSKPIKVTDMMKVFGAGWLGYAGTAGRRTDDFLPQVKTNGRSGKVFDEVMSLPKFGAQDFLAAEALFLQGKEERFGARGSGPNRAHTRYLFYYAFVQILRSVLSVHRDRSEVPTDLVSRATLVLLDENRTLFNSLCSTATGVIDRYFSGGDNSPSEIDFGRTGSNDAKDFMQSSKIDETNIENDASEFVRQLNATIAGLETPFADEPTYMDRYRSALRELLVQE